MSQAAERTKSSSPPADIMRPEGLLSLLTTSDLGRVILCFKTVKL